MAEKDGRDIGQHHAERGARGHRDHIVRARAQRDGRDLGLVAHLDQEERDQGGDESTKPGGLCSSSSSLSGIRVLAAIAMNEIAMA